MGLSEVIGGSRCMNDLTFHRDFVINQRTAVKELRILHAFITSQARLNN